MDARTLRLGALGGLVFAGGLLVQNAILLVGMPTPGAPLDEVEAYYVANAGRVALGVGLVAINLPAFVVFVSVAAQRIARAHAGALWARVAGSAVAILSALFGGVTVLQSLLVARMPALAADAGALGLAWDLHSAAFAMAFSGLALLVGALALGARAAALGPPWTPAVGLASSGALTVGAMAAVPVVEGSPLLWAGMAGFGLWYVFLVTTSLALLREARDGTVPPTPRPSPTS